MGKDFSINLFGPYEDQKSKIIQQLRKKKEKSVANISSMKQLIINKITSAPNEQPSLCGPIPAISKPLTFMGPPNMNRSAMTKVLLLRRGKR